MKFDHSDVLDQMNNAFEGTKSEPKSTKNKTAKDKKKKDPTAGLDPILEEKND